MLAWRRRGSRTVRLASACFFSPHGGRPPVPDLSEARRHRTGATPGRARGEGHRLNTSRLTLARAVFPSDDRGMSEKPNVVLVHGAWADGSCWSAVIEALQAGGYTVTAPQFPETSLAADVARLRQILHRQDGPTVVAGHSYAARS